MTCNSSPFRMRFTWLVFGCVLFSSLHGLTNSFLFEDNDDVFDGASFITHSIRSRHPRSTDESYTNVRDVLSLIPTNYSIHEPPPTNNSEATKVEFSVLIMNVRDIRALNGELSLEINLQIYWKDTRLSHLADRSGNQYLVLNPVLLDKLWHPDIFIDDIKGVSQPSLISKPASLRVYPDSSVRYSARLTITMACRMDFHYYPADTQRCNVDMKSYAYSNKVLKLSWRDGKRASLAKTLELPNFDVALDSSQDFMTNTSSGSYSGIRFTILLRRRMNYHLIQTYLPSTLFIIVSWLSFLVPPESVPGRMALCMTTLLTLTAMFSAVRQNMPIVSYVKALDIWMIVCIIFVFLTLVEYTVILKLKSMKPKPKPKPPQSENAVGPEQQPPSTTRWTWAIPPLQYKSTANTDEADISQSKNAGGVRSDSGESVGAGDAIKPASPSHQPVPPPLAPTVPEEQPVNKYEQAAQKIENITSIGIPALFVLFNFIYWPWLLDSVDYADF